MASKHQLRSVDTAALDALGSSLRRRIVELLSSRPYAVGELADVLPVSRPAVSKHLRVLEDAGLVVHEAEGNRHMYRLDAEGFKAARDWLDRFWAEALQRFRFAAENTQPRRSARSKSAARSARSGRSDRSKPSRRTNRSSRADGSPRTDRAGQKNRSPRAGRRGLPDGSDGSSR